MTSSSEKEPLKKAAALARVDLSATEEKKLLESLGGILDHFKELGELDTSNVPAMTGGTDIKNVFRDDEEGDGTDRGAGIESFPEEEKGFLKVPPVFGT